MVLFTDHKKMFSNLIARTAKDIDILIDSLPNEDSCSELQVRNNCIFFGYKV